MAGRTRDSVRVQILPHLAVPLLLPLDIRLGRLPVNVARSVVHRGRPDIIITVALTCLVLLLLNGVLQSRVLAGLDIVSIV